jgi:hypothetical protein
MMISYLGTMYPSIFKLTTLEVGFNLILIMSSIDETAMFNEARVSLNSQRIIKRHLRYKYWRFLIQQH